MFALKYIRVSRLERKNGCNKVNYIQIYVHTYTFSGAGGSKHKYVDVKWTRAASATATHEDFG